MPRHSFRFPSVLKDAVRAHVEKAIQSVNTSRYNQESPYTAALAKSMEGVAYNGPEGRVTFEATIVNDRGSKSAEKWSGVDLAITAEVSDSNLSIRKAILIQAKKGRLDAIPERERKRLFEQVDKMKKITKSPKIMDLPFQNDVADPGVYSGTIYRRGVFPHRYSLADYIVNRVLTTLDGDTRKEIVDGVQDSGLTRLKVIVEKSREVSNIRDYAASLKGKHLRQKAG